MESRTATAWLIERGQNRKQTPPMYWRSRGELPSDADEWTADPWQAARFSTRAAAQEAIHSLTVRLEAVGDPVEHAPLDVDEPTDAQIVAAWNEASKADWYATDSWTEHVARGRAFLAALRATPPAGAASE